MSLEQSRNAIGLLWNTKKHPRKDISKIIFISLATVYRVIKRIESEISLCHQKELEDQAK